MPAEPSGTAAASAGPTSDGAWQVFVYATWRDLKLAIIFFFDCVNFTDAIQRSTDTVGESPQFRVAADGEGHESEFRAH